MAWARLDDDFYDHPKVTGLLEDEPEHGWAALGFWTACLAWAHKHTRKPGKQPGHLPRNSVTRMDRVRGSQYAGLLVKAGLWELHPSGDGWLIHDFAKYLPTEKVSAVRAAAGRKGGLAKAANRSSELERASSELESSSKPLANLLGTPLANAGSGIGSSSSSVVGSTGSSPRPEVADLCTYLADKIEQNGSKRPNITKGWHDACRLLLDKDGRSVAQVRRMVDWCQADPFWRTNILSMPKLRDKYDQMRLRAMEEQKQQRQQLPHQVDQVWMNLSSG